jgi:ParB family chromosome partitioning protein
MSNIKKPKTAIGSVLSQLTSSPLLDASEVRPLKKTYQQEQNFKDFDFLSIDDQQKIISNGEIVEIDTNKCVLWRLKDRHKKDIGDIETLAVDIETNGQAQPGVVRYKKENSKTTVFEIIVGERRWMACKLKGLKFLAIIKTLNDKDAAILQATENLNRKNLSDYSKGMNYYCLIKEGILTQTELQNKLNIPKATLSDLLAFSQIPTIILEKIDDPTAISAKVASLIRSNSKKGEQYIEAIVSFSRLLSTGIGTHRFNQLLTNALSSATKINNLSEKFFGTKEKHLFTVKNDGKSILSISFPKNISKGLDINKFLEVISHEIENQLLEDK